MNRALFLIVAIGLFSAEAATAGSVFSTTDNPRTGSHHARVAVGRSCATDHLALPPGAIAGNQSFRACSTLSAHDVQVISGTVVLEAGDSVSFGSGFSVATGASLVVETGPLARGEGILEDRSPVHVTNYHARYFLDASALDLQEGERFEHFLALDAGGSPELILGIRRTAASTRLFLEASLDDGSQRTSEGTHELVLLPGWRSVEIYWRASSGVNDGRAEACLDTKTGSPSGCIVLAELDNDHGRIDSVLWGARNTQRPSMGLLDLDDFASWDGAP